MTEAATRARGFDPRRGAPERLPEGGMVRQGLRPLERELRLHESAVHEARFRSWGGQGERPAGRYALGLAAGCRTSSAQPRSSRSRGHSGAYSIGIGFPPGWGEGHVFDLKPRDGRTLQAGMTFHLVPLLLVPEMGAMGFSETVLVTRQGCEVLTRMPRRLLLR